ncbi:feruloyl esterase [Microdochium nivale]|nr:feruloyl esterase [Microdochium nivale]
MIGTHIYILRGVSPSFSTSGISSSITSVAVISLFDDLAPCATATSTTTATMLDAVSNTRAAAATLLLASLFGQGFSLPSAVGHVARQDVAPSNPTAGRLACTVDAIASLLAGNADVTVNFAQPVLEGGNFGGAGQGNIAFPTNATNLPALCAVSVNVKSSATSAYNFGVFLPDNTWNDRIMTTGNGGLGGGINWPDMGRFSKYGFASVSTDTGHLSNPVDGTWALNKPETIIDWGYRAMHGSVVLAKQIVNGYYAPSAPEGIKFSYYVSCSTGGRQGLREVQLHPESFDGISVGAPAWWTPHLSAQTLWTGLLNLPASDPKHIPPAMFPAIVAEMHKQCDPQDGLVDGIISDPSGCNFNFEALLCSSPDQQSCFTPAQLTTLYKFYNDWVDEGSAFVFPGMSIGASPATLMTALVPIGPHFFQNFIYNDTNWDPSKFSYADVKAADRVNPGNASADDFDAFATYHDRGGKIIMYHGDGDALIPAKSSTYLYHQVQQRLQPRGLKMDDFFRYFHIPGMGHCSGSTSSGDGGAPWYISGGSQTLQPAGTKSVPGFEDADHDVVLSLLRWVEGSQAPEHLIASKFQNDTETGVLLRQRPLCVYPKQAKYIGGDQEKATSWECRMLY